jgi:3-isopropylmalate dehydratase small subunit
MLPLVLPSKEVEALGLMAMREEQFSLDLNDCTLTTESNYSISFSLPLFRKEMLINGADEVATTLNREHLISQYESSVSKLRPWQLLSE